jgi:hypothetical protein
MRLAILVAVALCWAGGVMAQETPIGPFPTFEDGNELFSRCEGPNRTTYHQMNVCGSTTVTPTLRGLQIAWRCLRRSQRALWEPRLLATARLREQTHTNLRALLPTTFATIPKSDTMLPPPWCQTHWRKSSRATRLRSHERHSRQLGDQLG